MARIRRVSHKDAASITAGQAYPLAPAYGRGFQQISPGTFVSISRMQIVPKGEETMSYDYYTNGENATLTKARQAKYRRRQRLSMALLHAAEARGLSGTEAIAILQHADFQTLQKCAGKGITPAPDFDPNTLEFEQ